MLGQGCSFTDVPRDALETSVPSVDCSYFSYPTTCLQNKVDLGLVFTCKKAGKGEEGTLLKLFPASSLYLGNLISELVLLKAVMVALLGVLLYSSS